MKILNRGCLDARKHGLLAFRLMLMIAMAGLVLWSALGRAEAQGEVHATWCELNATTHQMNVRVQVTNNGNPPAHNRVSLNIKVDGVLVGSLANEVIPAMVNKTIVVAAHAHPHTVTLTDIAFSHVAGEAVTAGQLPEAAGVPDIVVPEICSSVGGIGEQPMEAAAAAAPLQAQDSSGGNAGLMAVAIASALAAGVVALAGAGWYIRRRLG